MQWQTKCASMEKMLTPYFGKVGEGVHKTRLFHTCVKRVLCIHWSEHF
jgi:hypothetical protein